MMLDPVTTRIVATPAVPVAVGALLAVVEAFKQYDRDHLVITDAGGTRLKIDLTLFTVEPLVEFVEQLDAGGV